MILNSERDKVAHLLRRFGLGASEAEIDYYGKDGLASAIDKLLDYDKVEDGFSLPITNFTNKQNGHVPMPAVQAHWILRMLCTRRPLQEKMTVFWHDHFATDANKVIQPTMMYQQNGIFREGATGSFADLLLNVSRDPAMIFWLDNELNQKGKPNENFAREVMELFTLGIGHYSEKDIQEAARAFTGWTIQRRGPRPTAEMPTFEPPAFRFAPFQHDEGAKTVFGKTGNFGGEDIIKMLCENPRTGQYITEKIWNWFVYEDPEPATIEKFAAGFIKADLNIKFLLRSIMESKEFYSDRAARKVVKNPVDFVIPVMRALGLGETAGEIARTSPPDGLFARMRGVLATASQGMESMGMKLLFPPDVSGWESGPRWITSATMVQRIGFADRLFGQGRVQGKAVVFGLDFYRIFSSDPSPEAVARQLVSIFDAPLPESKIKALIQAAKADSGGTITPENLNQTASKVSRLIFGCPEFQFA